MTKPQLAIEQSEPLMRQTGSSAQAKKPSQPFIQALLQANSDYSQTKEQRLMDNQQPNNDPYMGVPSANLNPPKAVADNPSPHKTKRKQKQQ